MAISDVIAQFSKMLKNLDEWLQAGVAYAEEKKFDPDVLAVARLAPDQYCVIQQVQSACDQAKFAAAYLSGQKPPSHPDVEKTIAELRTRIATCQSYLAGFKASDFAEAETRQVSPAWMAPHSVSGLQYTHRIAVPNFYFHATTAYAILRHNGVSLGKADFVGVKSWSEFGEP